MKRAVALAKMGRGKTNPNPMVGAVIVKNNKIIGEGFHEYYGGLHAERNAIKNCTESPKDADIYVTLEPCCHYGKTPPCSEAIIESGIKRVFIGSNDPNPKVSGGGIKQLKEYGVEVFTNVLKDECDGINEIFFHYITANTPYVIAKYALTADGKIATKTGDSKWISNDESRLTVHKIRNAVSGILVGIDTVISDNPTLNCRIENGTNPVRIICDSSLRIPPDCNIVNTAGEIPTIIAYSKENKEVSLKKSVLSEKGIELIYAPNKDGRVDLKKLMKKLGERKLDSVLIEGGSEILSSALFSGIVNKLAVFIAPKIFGGKTAKTAVGGIGISNACDSLKLKLSKVSELDGDVLVEYDVVNKFTDISDSKSREE